MDVVTKVNTKIGNNQFQEVPIGADASNVTMSNGMSLQTVGQNMENWHSEVANNIRGSSESTLVSAINGLTEAIPAAVVYSQVNQNTIDINDIQTESIPNLQSQVTSINSQISSINSQVTSINSQISSINSQVTSINNKVGSEDISGVGTSVTNAINQLNSNVGNCLTVSFAIIGGQGWTSSYAESTDITDDMVVVGYYMSNPSALESDLTITTGNGNITINGTISSETSLVLRLMKDKEANVQIG